VLRNELTSQAEHLRQLEAAHSHTMVSWILFTNATRPWRYFPRGEPLTRMTRCSSGRITRDRRREDQSGSGGCVCPVQSIVYLPILRARKVVPDTPVLPPSPSRRAFWYFDLNTCTSLTNVAQNPLRCVGVNLSSLIHRRTIARGRCPARQLTYAARVF
jgi:hypothetical protein